MKASLDPALILQSQRLIARSRRAIQRLDEAIDRAYQARAILTAIAVAAQKESSPRGTLDDSPSAARRARE